MNIKNRYYHQGKSWLAAAAITSLSASTLSAQIVAGWDTYSGAGDGSPVDAPVVADGVTASFVTTSEGNAWIIVVL